MTSTNAGQLSSLSSKLIFKDGGQNQTSYIDKENWEFLTSDALNVCKLLAIDP